MASNRVRLRREILFAQEYQREALAVEVSLKEELRALEENA